MENEIVWLTEERTLAVRLSQAAHYSLVKYSSAGTDYEVFVPNDEIEEYDEEGDADFDGE
jgi:hypothetical protein